MSDNEGKFTLKKILDLDNIINGNSVEEITDADLTLQHNNKLMQFKYKRPESPAKEPVKPGIYNFKPTPSGCDIIKTELRPRKLLSSLVNTKRIVREANTFFNKLDVYEKLNRPKKRGVLLYSSPGLGKSSAITQFCSDMVTKDAGTVILNWPTDQVKSSDIASFLSENTEFTKECTKLVLIIEDIGGGEKAFDGNRSVSASMLNLLDGVSVVFKLPTFIVATTNYPENLLGALVRPGRFDLMLELHPPSADERKALFEFISNREMLPEEETAIRSKEADGFSIAHIEEVIVRSLLHDKTIEQVIRELDNIRQKQKAGYEAPKKMGFNAAKIIDDLDFDYNDDDD